MNVDPYIDAANQEGLMRTMRYWLARTLRELRESKGVAFWEIAQFVPGRGGDRPYSETNLSRFEQYKLCPSDPDAVVAAYAKTCGVEDARDLWKKALEQWHAHGGIPVPDPKVSPQLRALLNAQEADQRTKRRAGESQEKPTSSRKKRASG